MCILLLEGAERLLQGADEQLWAPSISRIQTAQNHACVLPGALRVSDLGNVNIDHNEYIGGFKSGEITWLGIHHTLLGPRSEVPKINRIVRSNCTKNTQTHFKYGNIKDYTKNQIEQFRQKGPLISTNFSS